MTVLKHGAMSAPHVSGARGWSIAVYNPDLDPGNMDARAANLIDGVIK